VYHGGYGKKDLFGSAQREFDKKGRNEEEKKQSREIEYVPVSSFIS
jgi:hypothetical protein